MKIRTLRRVRVRYFKMRLSDLIYRAFRRHQSALVENVTRNNALLRLLQARGETKVVGG